METDIFLSWHSYFRLVYFAGGLAVGWIGGYISLRKIRSTLEHAKNIIHNPTIKISKKYEVAVEAIEEGCFYLGVVFEEYNRKQGTTPGWRKELERQEETKQKELEEVKIE